MRISIDGQQCQGHARCWDLSPELFDLDDEAHGIVRTPDVPAALEGKAREAVQNCPERAISIDADD